MTNKQVFLIFINLLVSDVRLFHMTKAYSSSDLIKAQYKTIRLPYKP